MESNRSGSSVRFDVAAPGSHSRSSSPTKNDALIRAEAASLAQLASLEEGPRGPRPQFIKQQTFWDPQGMGISQEDKEKKQKKKRKPRAHTKKKEQKETTYQAYILLPSESSPAALKSPALQLAGFYRTKKAHLHDPTKFDLRDYNYLLKKSKQIISKNEWLMGSYCKLGRRNLLVIKSTKRNPKNFVHEICDKSLFDPNLTFEERQEKLKKYQVDDATTILMKDSNICNFYFIRDHEEFDYFQNFAIIFSVNHMVADGATLYQLYNMLDMRTPVYEMNRCSVNFDEALINKTSLASKKQEMPRTAHTKKVILPFLLKSWSRSKKIWTREANAHIYDKYQVKMMNFRINSERIEQIKTEYQADVPKDYMGVNFVSTTDIMTSWFYQFNEKADNIRMSIDLRPRLDVLKQDLAGNYLSAAYFRKEELRTPMDVRRSLTAKMVKKSYGKNYTKFASFKDFRKYPIGNVTSWLKFYRSLKLPNLELVALIPMFYPSQEKLFGINCLVEDNLMLFRTNDEELGMFIVTGSGKLNEELITSDIMTDGQIFSLGSTYFN